MAVGLNSAIFRCTWHLPRDKKLPTTHSKLVFSQEVFLRCRTALEVIKVALAPESSKVFKVAYVLFSPLPLVQQTLLVSKGQVQFSVFLCGWLFR